MVEGSYGELKVEIENIKDDIKEIKTDSKETNQYFREVIAELKENSIRQTEILNNQEKKFAEVDTTLQKHTVWGIRVIGLILSLLIGAKIAGFDITTLLGL